MPCVKLTPPKTKFNDVINLEKSQAQKTFLLNVTLQ